MAAQTVDSDPIAVVEGDREGVAAALCRAAAEVIVANGLGAFSLREVARRAGVSHAAPAYHFGNTKGLLTAVAVQGLWSLERASRAAAECETDPIEKLVAVSRAYVGIALAHPGHCEVIWRTDLIDTETQHYAEAGTAAFRVLIEVIEEVASAHNPELPVLDTALAYWSAVQGQVVLQDKLKSFAGLHDHDSLQAADLLADRLTRTLIAGITANPA